MYVEVQLQNAVMHGIELAKTEVFGFTYLCRVCLDFMRCNMNQPDINVFFSVCPDVLEMHLSQFIRSTNTIHVCLDVSF